MSAFEPRLDERMDAVMRERFAPPPQMPPGLAALIDTARPTAGADAGSAHDVASEDDVTAAHDVTTGRADDVADADPAVTNGRAIAGRVPAANEASDVAARRQRPRAIGLAAGSPMRRRLAMVAGLAMLITGAWLTIAVVRAPRPTAGPYIDPGPQLSVRAAYASLVDEGFEPAWICEDDDEFSAILSRVHGQPLSMTGPADAGVRMLGVAPLHVWSRRTIGVLMTVDGRPVMVAIDRHGGPEGADEAGQADEAGGTGGAGEANGAGEADRTTGPDGRATPRDGVASSGGRPYLHRQQVGDLQLVEVSPFAEPRALPAFILRSAEESEPSETER